MPSDYSNLLLATSEEFDSAKRLSDIVNNLAIAYPPGEIINCWIAVRLSDGGTDGVLYDTRRDAVRHQIDEKQCAYLSLFHAPGGMDTRAAHDFLKYHRDAYRAGFRLPDPDHPHGGLDFCMPITHEDLRSQITRLRNRRKRG